MKIKLYVKYKALFNSIVLFLVSTPEIRFGGLGFYSRSEQEQPFHIEILPYIHVNTIVKTTINKSIYFVNYLRYIMLRDH